MTDSRNIPMTIFSANTMFIATLIEQGKPIMGYGKKLPLGKISAVVDGVITGFVDKNDNLDKASDIINIGLCDPIALDLKNNGKIDTLII